MQPILLGAAAAAGSAGQSPLDYSNLVAFWESETNVVDTAGEVDTWTDDSSAAIQLAQLGSEPGPLLESNTQNGFDGINFEETTAPDPIDRKLGSADSDLDDLFAPIENSLTAISFAGRLDRLQAQSFPIGSTICSKRYSFGRNEGWQLLVQTDGTIEFQHYRTDGTFWSIEASGFYSIGDLVLGSIRYSGGNSSTSGKFRLWNGSSFVETGTVTTATGSTRDSDAAGDFVVGNIYDPTDTSDNQPFQGPLFGLWITKPHQISLDDAYMQRWIP